MQIVIDLTKEYYKTLHNIPDAISTADMLLIKYGTPLPEHHGDLKDADKVECMLKNHAKSESEAWALVELLNVLDEVPTVLEATKEGDGE